MQQRYYDPIAGRFLSVDPVVTDWDSGSSFNRYVYAQNNPYRYTDPDGRQATALAGPAFVGGSLVCGPVCGAIATGVVVVGGTYIIANVSSSGSGESKPSPSQEAIDKIKGDTKPAEGQAGKDGVRVGEGGAAGAQGAIDTAKGVEGSKVLVQGEKTTVVQLPDGRKVESHTSTRGDKGGQNQGVPTVKIQDPKGKVTPDNILRYPEPKKE
jgi:uncharacterized protein RhaS with RHS repeats